MDSSGRRVELVELVDGIHRQLLELSNVVLATHMVLPGGTQPLWGTVRNRRADRTGAAQNGEGV